MPVQLKKKEEKKKRGIQRLMRIRTTTKDVTIDICTKGEEEEEVEVHTKRWTRTKTITRTTRDATIDKHTNGE